MPTTPTSSPPAPAPPSVIPAPSISPIVDAEYRIQATDLEGAPRQVEVANVTFQGVEAMTPVLHFVGQTKRLVLTPEQAAQMVDMTGTLLMDRWVGTLLLLCPHEQKDRIDLKPVTPRTHGRPMPVSVSEEKRGWILAFSVVGLMLCGSGVAVLLNYQTILATVQQLQELWPLR